MERDLLRIKLMTHEKYIAYFKSLAENHNAIAHVDDTRKAFFRANIEEILEGLPSAKLSYPCMILESFTGRIINDAGFFDNPVEEITGAFMILYKVKPNDYGDENEKLELARTIGLQCVAKMLNDFKRKEKWDDGSFKVPYFNPNSLLFEKVGSRLDNEFGYRFQFKWLDPQKINLGYDSSIWVPQVTAPDTQPITIIDSGSPLPTGLFNVSFELVHWDQQLRVKDIRSGTYNDQLIALGFEGLDPWQGQSHLYRKPATPEEGDGLNFIGCSPDHPELVCYVDNCAADGIGCNYDEGATKTKWGFDDLERKLDWAKLNDKNVFISLVSWTDDDEILYPIERAIAKGIAQSKIKVGLGCEQGNPTEFNNLEMWGPNDATFGNPWVAKFSTRLPAWRLLYPDIVWYNDIMQLDKPNGMAVWNQNVKVLPTDGALIYLKDRQINPAPAGQTPEYYRDHIFDLFANKLDDWFALWLSLTGYDHVYFAAIGSDDLTPYANTFNAYMVNLLFNFALVKHNISGAMPVVDGACYYKARAWKLYSANPSMDFYDLKLIGEMVAFGGTVASIETEFPYLDGYILRNGNNRKVICVNAADDDISPSFLTENIVGNVSVNGRKHASLTDATVGTAVSALTYIPKYFKGTIDYTVA